MAEICKAHGLAVGSDGKCVVCRRPPWETSEKAQQSARQQALTVILGLCLIAALARVVQLGLVDASAPGEPRGVAMGAAASEAQPSPKPGAPALAVTDAGMRNAAGDAETRTQAATEAPAKAPPKAPRRPSQEVMAQARKDVRVVMYASPWCYICDQARDQLLSHEVRLVEHDIDADPAAARRLTSRNPTGTVPTFEIGDQTLVGYDPWQLQDAVDAAAIAGISPP